MPRSIYQNNAYKAKKENEQRPPLNPGSMEQVHQ